MRFIGSVKLARLAALALTLAGPTEAAEPARAVAPPTLELYCYGLLDVLDKLRPLEGDAKALFDDARKRLATATKTRGYDLQRDPSPAVVAMQAILQLKASGDVTKVEDAVLRCMTVAAR